MHLKVLNTLLVLIPFAAIVTAGIAQTLDPKGSGYIPEETMVSMLTSNTEAFREKEIEEFLRVSKDPETGMINYTEYVNLLINSMS